MRRTILGHATGSTIAVPTQAYTADSLPLATVNAVVSSATVRSVFERADHALDGRSDGFVNVHELAALERGAPAAALSSAERQALQEAWTVMAAPPTPALSANGPIPSRQINIVTQDSTPSFDANQAFDLTTVRPDRRAMGERLSQALRPGVQPFTVTLEELENAMGNGRAYSEAERTTLYELAQELSARLPPSQLRHVLEVPFTGTRQFLLASHGGITLSAQVERALIYGRHGSEFEEHERDLQLIYREYNRQFTVHVPAGSIVVLTNSDGTRRVLRQTTSILQQQFGARSFRFERWTGGRCVSAFELDPPSAEYFAREEGIRPEQGVGITIAGQAAEAYPVVSGRPGHPRVEQGTPWLQFTLTPPPGMQPASARPADFVAPVPGFTPGVYALEGGRRVEVGITGTVLVFAADGTRQTTPSTLFVHQGRTYVQERIAHGPFPDGATPLGRRLR